MKEIMRSLRSGIEFLVEAAGRLFTPAEELPAIGVMPFGNDPYMVWEKA
jgi:hypothetical protein